MQGMATNGCCSRRYAVKLHGQAARLTAQLGRYRRRPRRVVGYAALCFHRLHRQTACALTPLGRVAGHRAQRHRKLCSDAGARTVIPHLAARSGATFRHADAERGSARMYRQPGGASAAGAGTSPNAVAAAFRDPPIRPLGEDELGRTCVEVSFEKLLRRWTQEGMPCPAAPRSRRRDPDGWKPAGNLPAAGLGNPARTRNASCRPNSRQACRRFWDDDISPARYGVQNGKRLENSRIPRIRRAGGTPSRAGASSATCARATKVHRRPARRLSPPEHRTEDGPDDVWPLVRFLHRSDRRRSRSTILPWLAVFHRSARLAATSPASSVRTGTSQSRRTWTA